MYRRVSLFSGLLAVAICLVVIVALPAEIRGQQVSREILPDAEFDVAPCCQARADEVRAAPLAGVPGASIAPPEGLPVTEKEIEQLRRDARALSPMARALDEVVQPIAAAPVAGDGDASAPGPGAPKISGKFSGIEFGDSGGFVPPDTQIAAGPGQLLQAVNSVIRLTDKSGKSEIVQTANEHWGEDDAEFIFDPKAVYDPLSGRFILVYIQLNMSKKQSFILLSVSRSSTPTTLGDDDWCNYKIKSKKGPSWADYPGLGVNEDWIAISTNNFKFSNSSFKQSFFWVMDKAAVVDNATSCPTFKTFRLPTKKDDDGRLIFNPQIAQHQSLSGLEGNPLFAVNTQFLGFSDQYVLWRITAKGAREGERATPRATFTQVTGSGYAFPPDATQKGSKKSVDAGDVRAMQQLVFADGALWVIHGSGCVFEDDGEVFGCLRVARIIPDDDGATIDFEDLFGVRDHFLYWPGIGVAGDGDVIALFQMSGKKRRLTASYNGLKNGAPRFGPFTALADSFDKVKDLAKGKCPTELPESGSAVRTGDYVGLSPDPSGTGVWLAAESAGKSSGTCGWKTTIALADY